MVQKKNNPTTCCFLKFSFSLNPWTSVSIFSFYEYLTLAPCVALCLGSLPRVCELSRTPQAARNTFKRNTPNTGAITPPTLPARDKPLTFCVFSWGTCQNQPSVSTAGCSTSWNSSKTREERQIYYPIYGECLGVQDRKVRVSYRTDIHKIMQKPHDKNFRTSKELQRNQFMCVRSAKKLNYLMCQGIWSWKSLHGPRMNIGRQHTV